MQRSRRSGRQDAEHEPCERSQPSGCRSLAGVGWLELSGSSAFEMFSLLVPLSICLNQDREFPRRDREVIRLASICDDEVAVIQPGSVHAG